MFLDPKLVDGIFEGMKFGTLDYRIVRSPINNTYMLDLRNGVWLGDVRVEKREQKDQS